MNPSSSKLVFDNLIKTQTGYCFREMSIQVPCLSRKHSVEDIRKPVNNQCSTLSRENVSGRFQNNFCRYNFVIGSAITNF